jgi:hypothetical protein
MTEKELNITLREMARKVGLCDEWYEAWSDDDTIDECLHRYVRGFDFAVKNDWPPLDFCRENFRKEELHRHNIYLDDNPLIDEANSGYYIFLGKSVATIYVKGLKVVTIYCRHDSVVNVIASEGSRVFIHYYDQSDGNFRCDKHSRVKTYRK